MGIQVPLLVIDQRCVSVMSTSFSNRRVRTLKVSMTVILWVYVFWCTEGCSESRIWLRTWRGVSKWSRHKDWYIGRIYLDTGKVPEKFGAPGGYRNPPGGIWALLGPCRRKREGAREGGAPPQAQSELGRGAGPPFPFSFPLFLLLLLVLLPNTSTLSFPLQIR